MTRKIALVALVVVPPIVLLCFCFSHPAAQAVFVVLAAGFPVALCVLGAARRGRVGPLAIPFGLLLVCLVGGFVTMLALRGRGAEGLPAAAVVMLVVGWLVPLVLVSLAYAAAFDRFTLREEDLERLRELQFPRDRES